MSNQKIMPKFKLEVGACLVSDKRQLKIIDREYRPKTKYKNDKPFTSNEKWYKYKCYKCGNTDWVIEH